MSLRLHQIKINCPRCGDFVYRVFKDTIIISGESNTSLKKMSELDPLCKTCNPRDFLEAATHATKIESLSVVSRIVKGKEVNKRIIEK